VAQRRPQSGGEAQRRQGAIGNSGRPCGVEEARSAIGIS
jgi:hypothetical protein